MTQQTERENYSQVVRHANVSASVSYVQRHTGLSYTLVGELMELALKNGDIAEGDYAGRKLEHYQDDRVASLQARISELEAALESKAQDVQMPEPVGVAFTFETEEGGPLASHVTSSPSKLPMGWCRLYTEQQVRAMLKDLQHAADFYKRRHDALQNAQSTMRDPERTIVCDILANGHLLCDSTGKLDEARYGLLNSAEFDGVKAAERVPLTVDDIRKIAIYWSNKEFVDGSERFFNDFARGLIEHVNEKCKP